MLILARQEEGWKGTKMETEDDDSVSELLRDRFRLSTISIAEYEGSFFFFPLENLTLQFSWQSNTLFSYNFYSLVLTNSHLILRTAKRNDLEVSETVVACIADLAFKYTGTIPSNSLLLYTTHIHTYVHIHKMRIQDLMA